MGNREKKLGNMEETSRANIHLIRVPKGAEEENGAEAILEEIMAKDVPELMENLTLNDLAISL